MTILTQHELRRHEWLAMILLWGGIGLWAMAAMARARQAWILEYTHAMAGVAIVMVFTALVWRLLAYAQPFRQRVGQRERLYRLMIFLGCYSLAMALGAAWLISEQRRLPELAWMRDRPASVVVLYALLAIAIPWVAVLVAEALSLGRSQDRKLSQLKKL